MLPKTPNQLLTNYEGCLSKVALAGMGAVTPKPSADFIR